MDELINGRMPEEIKTAIGHCIYGDCDGCLYEDPLSGCGVDMYCDTLALIDRLESRIAELEAKQPRWISVKDKLPEIPDGRDWAEVLVCWYGFGIYIYHVMRYYKAGNILGIEPGWMEFGNPLSGYVDWEKDMVAWMPLPEPPKEDAND